MAKASWHFQGKNLEESSVRDWKIIYEKELKDKCKIATPGKNIEITLPSKKQGTPPLLPYSGLFSQGFNFHNAAKTL